MDKYAYAVVGGPTQESLIAKVEAALRELHDGPFQNLVSVSHNVSVTWDGKPVWTAFITASRV